MSKNVCPACHDAGVYTQFSCGSYPVVETGFCMKCERGREKEREWNKKPTFDDWCMYTGMAAFVIAMGVMLLMHPEVNWFGVFEK